MSVRSNPPKLRIGDLVIGGDDNAVLYVDSSGNLATDPKLTYDGTDFELGTGVVSGENPFLKISGYDTGASAIKTATMQVDAAGSFNLRSATGESLTLAASGASSSYSVTSGGFFSLGPGGIHAFADDQPITMGAAGATDSYLTFGGTNLEFFSSGSFEYSGAFLELLQSADGPPFGTGIPSAGIKVVGFDEENDRYLNMSIDDNGLGVIGGTTGTIYFSPTNALQAFVSSLGIGLANGNSVIFGTNVDNIIVKGSHTEQTASNTLMIGLTDDPAGVAQSRSMIVADVGDIAFDFAHPDQANPTLFVHSANQATDEWVSLTHDQTDAIINWGTGDLGLMGGNVGIGATSVDTLLHLQSATGANLGFKMEGDDDANFGYALAFGSSLPGWVNTLGPNGRIDAAGNFVFNSGTAGDLYFNFDNRTTRKNYFDGENVFNENATSRDSRFQGNMVLKADNKQFQMGDAGATDSYLDFNGDALQVFSSGNIDLLADVHSDWVLDSTTNTFFGVGTSPDNLSHVSGTDGWYNTLIGKDAGTSLTTGYYNTAIGYNALDAATTGFRNIAIGAWSLTNNVSGQDNVAIGYWTLPATIDGRYNLAIGYQAMAKNQGGDFNVAMGYFALEESLGDSNIGLGASAARENTTGERNVGISSNALYYQQEGDQNIAIGYTTMQGVAAYNATGNVAVGYRAGLVMATGADYNTLLGWQAGDDLTTGSYNIALGYESTLAATADYQLSIGNVITGDMTGGSEAIGLQIDGAKWLLGAAGATDSYLTYTGAHLEIFGATRTNFRTPLWAIRETDNGNDALLFSAGATSGSFFLKSNGATTIELQGSTGKILADGGAQLGADSTHMLTEADGDSFWVGEGTGIPYGHMYTNSTISVTITDTTPVEVGDTWTTGQVNLVTFGASHYLTVTKAGRYKIDWAVSAAQNSPSAQIEVEFGIMIDGVAQVEGAAHRTIRNSTDIGAIASTAILDLAASKQISLYVANETNGTDIDVEHANVTVTMVGGT